MIKRNGFQKATAMRDFAIDLNGRKPLKNVASFNETEQKSVLESLRRDLALRPFGYDKSE